MNNRAFFDHGTLNTDCTTASDKLKCEWAYCKWIGPLIAHYAKTKYIIEHLKSITKILAKYQFQSKASCES